MNAFRALQRAGATTHAEQAWLYKIARHVCDARGTLRRRRLAEAPNAFHIAEETVPAPASDEAGELIGLDAVLEAMPENQRRAILLREWRGLSYREIADELELTQTAVEMLIFRARKALARRLEAPAPREQRAFASA